MKSENIEVLNQEDSNDERVRIKKRRLIIVNSTERESWRKNHEDGVKKNLKQIIKKNQLKGKIDFTYCIMGQQVN